MNELALFAGAGGGILGGTLLGWRTVCAVEWDAYAASVLVARQNDKSLPPFPIWDDVQTFDGQPWRGRVDVVSGGFPCQDISSAGKGAGIDGERSGMWGHMARIVDEVRPRFVFVENSPLLVGRGLARVLGDLTQMGYDARWGIMGAHHVAAPHKRDRCWVVAHAKRHGSQALCGESGVSRKEGSDTRQADIAGYCREDFAQWWKTDPADVADPDSDGGRRLWEQMGIPEKDRQGRENPATDGDQGNQGNQGNHQGSTEPILGRVADGVANRVDRLKCCGNGQVPAVAALAWKTLTKK